MGRLIDAWKALTSPRRPRRGTTGWYAGTGIGFIPPSSQFDYFREAGDLKRNSVFTICHGWLARQFLQPDWCVGYETKRDEWEPQKHHSLRKLLENLKRAPDPRRKTTNASTYGGAIGDYLAYGNAYLLIEESGLSMPAALEWIPAKRITVQVGDEGVDFYRRALPGGGEEVYDAEEIVHVKFLPDPDEPVMGIGPVQNQIRNVAAVNVGERTNAALLRNGTMGKVLVPKVSVESISHGEMVDEAAMSGAAAKIKRHLRGEGVNSLIDVNLPIDLLDMGATPEDMAIKDMLDRPESMIIAACGLNSLVLNMTSSRDTRTYANYAEAERQAWCNGVIPLRESFEDAFTSQLGPRYDESGLLRVWSDYDDVQALKDDMDKRSNTASVLFTSGLMTRNEARKAGGFDPVEDEEGEKYFGEPTEAQVEQEREAMEREQEQVDDEGDLVTAGRGSTSANGKRFDTE